MFHIIFTLELTLVVGLLSCIGMLEQLLRCSDFKCCSVKQMKLFNELTVNL